MRVFILVASLFAAATAENSYMAVFRKSFRADMTYSVQVRILNATGDVAVTVDLRSYNGQDLMSTASETIANGEEKTLQLKIPPLTNLTKFYNDKYWNQNWYRQQFRLVVKGEGGLTFKNFTYITFSKKSFSIYIQTDKAMYKPGQKVQFRVLAAYPNMKMVLKPVDIHIYDAKTNKIKQFLGETSKTGVISKSLQLSKEPVLGDWKIKAIVDKLEYTKTFTVAKYVLPKFEVSLELPSYGLTKDRDIVGKVKAKYTFGKPVNGLAILTIKKKSYYYSPSLSNLTKEFKLVNGEAPFSIPTYELQTLMNKWQRNQKTYSLKDFLASTPLNFSAQVREDLTGNYLSGSSLYKLYRNNYKLMFLSTNPTYFKPGLSSTLYFKMTFQDDRPVVNIKDQVTVSTTFQVSQERTKLNYYSSSKTVDGGKKMLDVPNGGYMSFTIETVPENTTNVNVKILCKGSQDSYHDMQAMESPSQSFVAITLVKSNLKAGDMASFRIRSTENVEAYSYQIFSRGKAVASGFWKAVPDESFNYELAVTNQMAPSSKVLVFYVTDDGEIVADSISFNVAEIYENKVALTFSDIKVKPQDEVTLTVTADPNSVVNILTVDKSVKLLKSGNDITSDMVRSELATFDETYYPNTYWGRRFKRDVAGWWWWPRYYSNSAAYAVFDNAGYMVLTDALLPKAKTIPIIFTKEIHPTTFKKNTGTSGPDKPVKPKTKSESTRKLFPETWLWTDKVVAADGTAKFTTKIPDTITTWIASAFATNPVSGLGVADNTASVTVFLPFFVSMDLPYSVVRGEEVIIQAIVFNYLNQDVDAKVTLESATGFQNINIDANGTKIMDTGAKTNMVKIKSQEGKTVYFPIVANVVGTTLITIEAATGLNKDRVQRQLLVEPEGLRQEQTVTELIDLRDTRTSDINLPISYPNKTVEGSELVKVSVIGDILGTTMENLDRLLRLPTGCGEQNLAKFVPDVHILTYLNSTGQSEKDIIDKAVSYLESGYQHQLTFRHSDGSFSTWGDVYSRYGNTWLTSFVAKSFIQAKPYIYIDDRVIVTALRYIVTMAKSNGTFREKSRRHGLHVPFSEVDQTHARAAYTYITMIIAQNDGYDKMVNMTAITKTTRQFLELGIKTGLVQSPYALAMIAYALKISDSPVATEAMDKLNAKAKMENGLKRWENKGYLRQPHPWYRQSPARDIETAAYAALTLLYNSDDLQNVLPILKWLATQRNYYGGFFSTQDTVVALQAFAEFGAKAYRSNSNINVNMKVMKMTKQFNINPTNRMVRQTFEFANPKVDKVELKSSGEGTALAQAAVIYHVEHDYEEKSFHMSIKITEENINAITLNICTRRSKSSNNTGMVMMEIGVPSGFTPDEESIGHRPRIKRRELVNKKLILYLDFVSQGKAFCFPVDIVRTGLVAKSQPAAVVVYDYYEPGNQIKHFYKSQFLTKSDVCDVCGSECGCVAIEK